MCSKIDWGKDAIFRLCSKDRGFCQKFEDIAGFVRFSFSSLLLCPFGYLLSRL